MKVILKTLTGKEYIQEVSPQTKVEEIKQTLDAEYVTEGLRLCCNGSTLDNTKTVEELGLQENAVLIIAGKKRKVQRAAEKVPNTVNAESTEKSSSANAGETNKETPTGESQTTGTPSVTETPSTTSATTTTAATVTTSGAQATTTTTAPPSSFQGTDTRGIDPALIDSIVAMGFEDRGQVALALRTAYMNPDRAVEFLCNGIPTRAIEQMAEEMNVPTTHPGQSAGLPNRMTIPSDRPQGGGSNLRQALMNIPDFEEIRSLVQSNPQALAAVLQQLQLHYPEIIQLIQQNPEEFGAIMMGGGPIGAGGVLASAGPPLGEEEQAAVQRLVSLGGGMWSEHDAIVAYRACEQNEEAAAQLLLESFFGANS